MAKKRKPKEIEDKFYRLADKLGKTPKRDKRKQVPHFQIETKGIYMQADLLYLPTAKYGFKYLLVLVDGYDRTVDAVPMKERTKEYALRAFEKMFATKDKEGKPKKPIHKLSTLKEIAVDPGSEFKNDLVKAYFKKHNVKMTFGKTARHRNQALVEAQNKRIAKYLFRELTARELQNKRISKNWYGDKAERLEKAIKSLNERNTYKPLTYKQIKKQRPIIPTKKEGMFFQGDAVHTILERPVQPYNDKPEKVATFRATDLRFKTKPTTVKSVLVKSGFPFLYSVEDDGVEGRDIYYTKNQLLEAD